MIEKPSYLINKKFICSKGSLIDLSSPLIMGILNITPDSFFDGGKYQEKDDIQQRVRQLVKDGVDIIDVGAYSSRPGAKHISEEEELGRLDFALNIIRKEFPEVVVSVDTFRANIAKCVVREFEVNIINDISAGEIDLAMIETVAELNIPYVIMHMKGTPQNMQSNPLYSDDIVFEVIDYFAKKIEHLKKVGVHDVILDPGFGFGKTIDHNYELLSRLNELNMFELPLLVGISRKSMIYKLFNNLAKDALNATTALNMLALEKSASILRVHDVKEAKECVMIYHKINQFK